MDECYSAWWDAQFLNLIQMPAYYSTTSPLNTLWFWLKAISSSNYFPSAFSPIFSTCCNIHYWLSLSSVTCFTAFLSIFFVLILSSPGLLSDSRQKAGLFFLYTQVKGILWSRNSENCQFRLLNRDKATAFLYSTSLYQCQTTDQLQKVGLLNQVLKKNSTSNSPLANFQLIMRVTLQIKGVIMFRVLRHKKWQKGQYYHGISIFFSFYHS